MVEIAPRIGVATVIRFGKPVIMGNRVPVEVVVSKIAGGMTTEDVAAEYGIARDDVLAALAYAAQAVSREGRIADSGG